MSSSPPEPIEYPIERSCPFDPPPALGALRGRAPLSRMAYPGGSVGWVATRHAEARAILAEPRFSARNDLHRSPVESDLYSQVPAPPGMFNKMDPPDHTRYRKLLAPLFTVRRTAALAERIEQIAVSQLDAFTAGPKPADLVAGFAEPLPSIVICELLGVPDGIRLKIVDHMKTISFHTTDAKRAGWSMWALHSHVQQVVQTAIARPDPQTVLGHLAGTGELSTEELVHLTSVLLVGGHDTVTGMLGLGVFALLEHPEELRRVRADPELIPAAVEELLRYLTISHLGAGRCALEDVEVGGETVAAGETVTVALSVANRDPDRFEDPDRLDVTRSARGHVAFGHGVHQCVGQHLARSILQIGYRVLFERLPDLAMVDAATDVPLGTDQIHLGPSRLTVTW